MGFAQGEHIKASMSVLHLIMDPRHSRRRSDGGKYVVVHRCSQMLGLEIMMEIISIYLPPSDFFARKEPTTIKSYIELIYPVLLILSCLRRSHHGFRPCIDSGTPHRRNQRTRIRVKRTLDVSSSTRPPPKTVTNMCPLSFRCSWERPRSLFVSYPFLRPPNLALNLVLIFIGAEVRSEGIAQTEAYFCLGPRATLVGTSPALLLSLAMGRHYLPV
jgi:hypothetical protein